jgi:hypothetical protein
VILKEWLDGTTTTFKDDFVAGLTAGLQHPAAGRPRFVIVKAGRKNRFINDAKFIFLAKMNPADYHDELDREWKSCSRTSCCLTLGLEE